MAKHLLDNVYQVGGGDITHPLDGASYLVRDSERNQYILIDCGSQQGYLELARQLLTIDAEIDKVATVYGTHCHFDHVSAAASMKQATLRVHPDDYTAVVSADLDLTASFMYDQAFPVINNIDTVDDSHEVAVGGTIVTAIHTPGHTPGSMCYKLATKEGTILIAGDTLWGGCEDRIHSDLDAWEESLEKLQADQFDYVSFGHGISRLVPNAMAHIALAQSHFRVKIERSHGGLYLNPWADPLVGEK